LKYYVIAGEASGDLHGANLIKGLNKLDSKGVFRCWGGEKMQEQGAEIIKHYKDLAFMGFVPVLLNIRTIFKNIAFCKNDILEFNPDVLILVDYPGFNLRIAEFASKNNIKVFYYISPTVWAWHKSRIKKIKQFVNQLFVILPFEKDFYKKHELDVDFEGHPLLDALEFRMLNKQNKEEFLLENGLPDKPIIALLAGSRVQEVKKMLPVMLSIIDYYKDFNFVIAGVKSLDIDLYKEIIGERKLDIVFDKTYELLQQSEAALVTSGTATLETALLKTPQVVCYKTGALTFFIAKKLVDIKYISLVNLIMENEVVKELIQNNLNKTALKYELDKILFDSGTRQRIISDYNILHKKLGGAGASNRIAEKMFNYLTGKI
jgi:lipid-A-disaccharide synthase